MGAGRIIGWAQRYKAGYSPKIGATDAVNNTKTDAGRAVMELTGSHSADLVVETWGGACVQQAIEGRRRRASCDGGFLRGAAAKPRFRQLCI